MNYDCKHCSAIDDLYECNYNDLNDDVPSKRILCGDCIDFASDIGDYVECIREILATSKQEGIAIKLYLMLVSGATLVLFFAACGRIPGSVQMRVIFMFEVQEVGTQRYDAAEFWF